MLNGIVGRAAGTVDGFKYSGPLMAKAEEGLIWTPDALSEFLAAPKSYIKGTKMSFAGLKDDADLEAVVAYLASYGG
jgi:cytochrome c